LCGFEFCLRGEKEKEKGKRKKEKGKKGAYLNRGP
jgi:hypothetical protein